MKKENNSIKQKKQFNKRKLKYGSLATAVTVIFTVIVVLVNVFASTITEKYPLKLDLTSNKIFEVSQDTIDYVSEVNKNVDIVVMADEATFDASGTQYKQVSEIVKKYQQYSDKVKVEFVDMDKNPNKVSKYKELYTGDITNGSIVINSGEKIKVLGLSDVFNIQDNYIVSSKAEQAITSAIMYVTDANPVKVAFLTGDMPDTASSAMQNLISLIDSNGYEISECDILLDAIPEDTDMLIIPAPLNDYTSAMIDKISDFLYNDGKLGKEVFYIGDFNQNNTPNLYAFLEEWGISIDNSGVIMEQDDNMKQPVPIYSMNNYYNASIAQIVNEDYQGTITDSTLPIVVPFARPISLVFESSNDREASIILSTPNTSAVYPDDPEEGFDIAKAPQSSMNVMALGTKFTTSNNERIESKVMVLSSAEMIDVAIMQDKSYNNSEFTINALNKLTGREDTGITILDKSLESTTLNISESTLGVLRIVVVVLIPLVVIVIGIVITLRRKNR